MSGGQVRICVLGRLAVERDGAVTATGPGGRRAELALALLAIEHRRLVTRDELADALWPELLPDSWAAALRAVVSDVRRFLDEGGLDGGALVERSQGGYRLLLPAGAVLDVDDAFAAVEEARRLLDGDPAGAAQRSGQAATVAALPFLPDHEGTWVDGMRRRLAALEMTALDLQARALSAAGDQRSAIEATERLVGIDPYSEPAYQLLIELHAAAGDRAGALRAYEACRQVLADEVGVQPAPATEHALRAALRGMPAAAASEPSGGRFAEWSVLVVEDHDFQRRTALALLRSLGVGHLAEAIDGAQALRLLATSGPPDIIVCDLDMPGMDGMEFIRHVADRQLGSAVIVASGMDRGVLTAVEAVAESHGLQVLGAVKKPLTARSLAELLDRYRPAPRDDAHLVDAPPGDIVGALERDEVRIGFAPVIDLTEGRVAGASAGAVWHDPARGSIPATSFLPVLHRSGHTRAFTEHLVGRACAELVELTAAKLDVQLWLPLPDAEIADPALADRLAGPVKSMDLDPADIVWVATMTGVRRRRPEDLGSLVRLRLKGFGLAVDGVGVGGAPATGLERLPLTAIRLDERILADEASSRVARLEEALALSRRLNVDALVPGCKTADDVELLVSIGCRLAEGQPGDDRAPAGAVAAMVESWELPLPAGNAP